MENMSIFSERLKELMAEREIRSETLARETHIAGSSIRSWLRGDSFPTFSSAVKLADFFSCSLAGLSDKFESVSPRPLPPFYPRLRHIMEEQGVTRFWVTEHTHIKDAFFTNWSHGQLPILPTLSALASCLNVSLDYLVGRTDY